MEPVGPALAAAARRHEARRQQLAAMLPVSLLRQLLTQPWLRGLVSGFGLVHLVWAAHHIALVLRRSAPHAAGPAPARRQ